MTKMNFKEKKYTKENKIGMSTCWTRKQKTAETEEKVVQQKRQLKIKNQSIVEKSWNREPAE